MKKFILILMMLSTYASAGTQIGTVQYVIVRASDGLTYFTLANSVHTQKPDCATADYWIIKDENSTAGKSQYAMILSAQASGKTVKITGMNTCSRWRDGEDANSLQMYP